VIDQPTNLQAEAKPRPSWTGVDVHALHRRRWRLGLGQPITAVEMGFKKTRFLGI